MREHPTLYHLPEEHPEEIHNMVETFGKHPELKPIISVEQLDMLCEGNEQLDELKEEMLEYMFRYTQDVCIHERADAEKEGVDEVERKGKERSILHNAMIDSVRILARNLNQNNLDGSWIAGLEKGGRAAYARFALLTTYQEILKLNKEAR